MEQDEEELIHISADKRSMRSAQRIGQGLLRCLQRKPFEEITVTDVQLAAEVGRATFYRLFDHTADVLAYLCDDVFEQAGERIRRLETKDADATTLAFICVWEENKALLKAIVDSGRTDILIEAHIRYLAPVGPVLLNAGDSDETQLRYLMTTLTACMAGFLTAWIKGGATESAQQLQQRLRGCFCAMGGIFA